MTQANAEQAPTSVHTALEPVHGPVAEKTRSRLVSRTIGGVARCTLVDLCSEGRET